MISRSGGRVTILDDQGLRRAAERAERRTAIDLSWLPVPQRA